MSEIRLTSCVHVFFEERVEKNPDAIALLHAEKFLTYDELNRQANQLAHYLLRLGIKPECVIGIYLERSLEQIIAILGVLKAGGAYVPLDPAYPQERVTNILTHAQVDVLLTWEHLAARLPTTLPMPMLCLDTAWPNIEQESTRNPLCLTDGYNLAYIIYTSGSTGLPKGVMIQHASLLHYTRYAIAHYALQPADHILQFASFCFDASIEEIFPSLLSGATLFLRTDTMLHSFSAFWQTCREWAVTVISLPTAYWHEIVYTLPGERDLIPPMLRLLVIGGEKAQSISVATWLRLLGQNIQVMNTYGPTETTVVASTYDLAEYRYLDNPLDEVPIGTAIDTVELYILDQNIHPVKAGAVGELFIGGPGLARGYLKQPETTAEKFLPHPFSITPGQRLYKTGDLIKQRTDGTLEFCGRVDQQIKLRGYRIELGEIEATLRQHPAIKDVVVLTHAQQLVAYLVATRQDAIDSAQLQRYVQDRLPSYMVPATFLLLEKIPLTVQGKVERHALPLPERTVMERSQTFVAPRTATEQSLADIWSEVLGDGPFSVDENFFALGGHSLAAMRILACIRSKLHVDLSLPDLFRAATIEALAHLIDTGHLSSQWAATASIQRVARNQELPLSFSQERIWFLQRLFPAMLSYNTQNLHWLIGELDVTALGRSINEITRRHEVLRTTFPESLGYPVQVIHPYQWTPLQVIDVQDLPEDERVGKLRLLTQEQLALPFDLTQLPLLRWILFRLRPREHVLLLVEHHLIHDGWSANILLSELLALYEAFSAGQPSPLPDLPIQFADFAVWQRQWVQGEQASAQLAYWKIRLLDCSPLLELPTDRPRAKQQRFRGAAPRIELSPEQGEALRSLARREGVTLFMTMLSVLALLFYRYSGQEDLCIGTGIANRRWRETEGLLGMIINNVVLRIDLAGNPTFQTLLHRVREVTLEAYDNQDIPFDHVVRAVRPPRDLSHNPLFQVMFSFHDAPMPDMTLSHLSVHMEEALSNGSSKFDMNITVIPRAEQYIRRTPKSGKDALTVIWEYDSDLFDASTVERMLGYYQQLLGYCSHYPQQPIAQVPLLREYERQQMMLWNTTRKVSPPPFCLHQLFEAQVERTPGAAALLFETSRLTYHELDERANQVAWYLRSQGVRSEVLVGICMLRSLEMVIALLGVLKAGGAYVPLDPTYPQERLRFICAETQITIVLTHHQVPDKDFGPIDVVNLDTQWQLFVQQRTDKLENVVVADNLAYIIYTSGSTGTPKGAMNTHRGICNRLFWMQEHYQLSADDRVLQKTPFSFDVSVWEFFWPLITGSCLVLARPEGHKDSAYLAALIAQQHVTILHFVPSMLRTFLDEPGIAACGCIKLVVCSGEALSIDLQERFFEYFNAALYNMYGPTEASIDVSFWDCVKHTQIHAIPLGYPIANIQLYVLDTYLQQVPIGVPGELYIGGVGLARGYMAQPGLTAAQFIPDPSGTFPGARLYKTGDRVRYLPDGALEFLGRLDYQVKLRGFRIELGEIETMLNQYPGIQQSVVTIYEEPLGDKVLVAYIVSLPEQSWTISALRHFLQRFLPEYMLPAMFVPLSSLPLTTSGKVNPRLLPAPEAQRSSMLEEAFVAPTTPVESVLANIFCQMLSLKSVGIYDNFFELGGHSLQATRVVSSIRKILLVDIPIRHIFETPTIAQLAEVLGHYESQPGVLAATARLRQKIQAMSIEEMQIQLAKKDQSGNA